MAKNSSWPVTGLGNKGPLKVLYGTKLIIDDHGNNLDSFRISLESFRSFRGPLLLKPVTGQELFFAVSYSKLALDFKSISGHRVGPDRYWGRGSETVATFQIVIFRAWNHVNFALKYVCMACKKSIPANKPWTDLVRVFFGRNYRFQYENWITFALTRNQFWVSMRNICISYQNSDRTSDSDELFKLLSLGHGIMSTLP